MSRRGGRPLVPVLVTSFVLLTTACAGKADEAGSEGGGDGAGSNGSGGDGGDELSAEEALARNACPDDVRVRLPDGFDPATCWSVAGVHEPVLVGDRVFGVAPVDGKVPTDGSLPPLALAAFDVATGARVWVSDPLPGEVIRTAAVDLDGDPGVAVLVSEEDDGDAVTAASVGWGYLAWPADVGEDGVDSDGEPAVHVVGPSEQSPSIYATRWTEQGLLAGDGLLRPGADDFAPVVRDVEPMLIDEVYDLGETFSGVSGGGDVLLSYVNGVAWPEGGPDDGNSYVGWLARDPDGARIWDSVIAFPNQNDIVISAEGPDRLPVVVGDYALTIAATDDGNTDFTVEWLDAASGQPATPTAADLAGSVPNNGVGEVVQAQLSPDGRYLTAHTSEMTLVVDVEAGSVQRVASDFAIDGAAVDDTTLYGTTDNGSVTVDLATAVATPAAEGSLEIDAVAGDTAVLGAGDAASVDLLGLDALVVARRS